MATAAPTRKKAPARKKTTARKRADNGQSPADLLQGALDDLTAARERASDDIRSGIDSAIDRTRDALREAGSDAQAQIGDWRRTLEKTSDEIRREFGLVAVKAQTSPDALKEMAAEIRKRKTEIGGVS